MPWISLVLLAFGTSADAFVVSLARTVACSTVDRRAMTLAALTFGMTAVVATAFGIIIAGGFEWMAISGCRGMGVVLIAILGTRCFRCGILLKIAGDRGQGGQSSLEVSTMMAAAAASIDCLAAGAGVAIDDANVPLVLIAIGIGSGLASALGAFIGRKMLCVGVGNAECIGGLSLFLFAGVSWIW